jgi:hypothetical protein
MILMWQQQPCWHVEELFGGGDDLTDSWQQLTIVPTTTALLEETKERALLSIKKKCFPSTWDTQSSDDDSQHAVWCSIMRLSGGI